MPRTLTVPLLKWFDAHRREMPWRADRDPYRIWVSEVMLQQTTVAAVIPYFNRFMVAFPTVHALAAAPQQQVLRLWQGLGYYSRARNLHAAAAVIVAEHGGVFPQDPAAAAALPGVGRYICGAVLSQAYELREPIVEANTLRLYARLFAYRGDPRVGAGQEWAWKTAQGLLPRARIGDFNQALMELGSQVCKPKQPRCGECPLRRQCQAFALGAQDEIPVTQKRLPLIQINETTVIVRHQGECLLVQLPDNASRWGGLWEFPRGEQDARALVEATTGLKVQIGGLLEFMEYRVTRHKITLLPWVAATQSRTVVLRGYSAAVWVPPEELSTLPMSTPMRRVAAKFIDWHRKRRRK
jgi:A/G-specific adenine glycosylase